MDSFRVRLNCIDFYQAPPTRLDPLLRANVQLSQLQKEPKVPVIRVFGATETGQKVCAHVHGAFPYLYIEYTGKLVPDEVGAYIHRLHLSIDYALAVSYRRKPQDEKAKFVARITLVKGIPFYGFHVGYQHYLKIYMLNPKFMTRLADLLRQGVIMKKVFQPYEAHLQYLLQWMADYNLYGCGYIDCRKVTFRSPIPQYEDLKNPSHLWHDRSIPNDFITPEPEFPRVSHCSIEVDICLQDIINRQEIKARPLHHDFIERLNPITTGEKLVHSMAGLWREETRRRKAKMSNASPGNSPFPPEVMVSMSADPRNSQPGGWVHEEEYRELMASLIKEEKDKSDSIKVSFDNFVKVAPFSSSIKSSLESVEDLYPEKLRLALGLAPVGYDRDDREDQTEVDEKRILDFDADNDDDLPYDSDEEVMAEIISSQRKKGDRVEGTHTEVFGELGEQNQDLKKSGKSNKNCEESSGGPSHRSSSNGCPAVNNARDTFDDSLCSYRDFKRPGSPTQKDDLPTKRAKISIGFAESPTTISSDLVDRGASLRLSLAEQKEETTTRLLQKISKPTPRTKTAKLPTVNGIGFRAVSLNTASAHELPKGVQGNQKSTVLPLSFPVVKDPLEPTTISRLSQKSGFQLSQQVKGMPFPIESVMPPAQKETLHPMSASQTKSIEQIRQRNTATHHIKANFEAHCGTFLIIGNPPPARQFVVSTIQEFALPQVIYQDAYYSNEQDTSDRFREWAGREFKLESLTVPFLPRFDPTGTSIAYFGDRPHIVPDRVNEERTYQLQRHKCYLRSWAIAEQPPSYLEVVEWVREQEGATQVEAAKKVSKRQDVASAQAVRKLSQIDGPTQKNKHGFKFTQKKKTTRVKHESQYMSTMSLEIHVNTRGNLVPNPEEDQIQCIFWCLQSEDQDLENNCATENSYLGIVALSDDGNTSQKITRQSGIEVVAEDSELDLMIRVVEIVRSHDPDILTGYEVHGGSWGYIIERARLKYDYNLCDEFSRTISQSFGRFGKDNDKWGFNTSSTIRITGRHVINIWRAMRGELNLLQYTIENVAFHVLHRRIPHYTWADLTSWYTNQKPGNLGKIISHYISKVQIDLEILEQNELIARNCEQARVLGVDFFSVFSRGSQFKVESLMFRIAKPENFMLVSPSRKQVGSQNALECLPLVMEPQSAFYNSPLMVLDFQSLYPSVMIAYNYCYSTFLGRIVNWRGTSKMGFTEYKRQQRLLELLKDYINIAPNGMMYVKPEIRKSLLAKMLGEILETRVMIKSGMQADKDDKTVQRLLNNRQLALKLIANVTYGYTSASFSGRMPCSEIADSIVQTGRETLERAIALIHSVKRWGAEVVYGDTDSLFVYLKGRTKDEAFDIGEEIAKTITDMNPRPIKLKFEKVYLPCVLLAKKRYVGFKYEYRSQKEPDFDAKGIETVRRDGTPAEQKIEEKALKILFRTADLSQVKSYFQKQCEKIMKGSISIQDFCFAKEVKLGTYSEKGPPPPGALISTKRMLEDARAEPQYGERVPYVVVTGVPGARLIDRCVSPEELLENEGVELDAEYYISKNLIPPLERIFNVVGANVRGWYDEMPKFQRVRRIDPSAVQSISNPANANINALAAANKKTLESYLKYTSCIVCKSRLPLPSPIPLTNNRPLLPICPTCLHQMPHSLLTLRTRLNAQERMHQDLEQICRNCEGISMAEARSLSAATSSSLRRDLHAISIMGLAGFLLIYVLGGITLPPLLLVTVLMHSYFALPAVHHTSIPVTNSESITRPGDDIDAIKNAQESLDKKWLPRDGHDSDVAAGYFAVCREYIPGGAGGKPPERSTPVGSTAVIAPSPSVYQSIYRSVFERKQNNSPLDKKGNGRPPNRSGNVFYVVLRHGHLILFDDDDQIEVRHVVSLAHHNVSIYSGGDETPEGELFIKRNALCLSRKVDAGELTPDGKASKPFFLFSENCSEKEDFYFAMLRNQERRPDALNNPPKPLQYEVKDIIKLVQRLHSSEEHLQTGWLNAIVGRIFLALYRTSEVEDYIRAKITKKISRVKTPSFLSQIALRNINLGEAAPVLINPRLKELTVDGELIVEADCRYSGNFRIEVAAVARIELGSRFKAREVNLLLAVMVKRVEGHVMLRIKPSPSNRFWITFETMPKIDMSVEPIVSSRQITYTLILRQIENRIKEVVAESLVYPNWDDSPFYNSEGKLWRGGIWADDRTTTPHDPESLVTQNGNVEEVEVLETTQNEPVMALPQMEKSLSMPQIDASPPPTIQQRKGARTAISLTNIKANSSSTSVETQASTHEKPRALRSGSFVGTSSPIVGTDSVNADVFKPSTPPEKNHAATAVAAMSALSQATSPAQAPVGSPQASRLEKVVHPSSESLYQPSESEPLSQMTSQPPESISEVNGSTYSPSSASSMRSEATRAKSFGSFPWDRRHEDSSGSSAKSTETKLLSLAAVTSAATTAKNWGWSAIQRKGDNKLDGTMEEPEKGSRPLVLGRGQPLPPPGVPLPHPDRKSKTAPIPVPKRKTMPPPATSQRNLGINHQSNESTSHTRASPVPPPPLPKRRGRENPKDLKDTSDSLLVVTAPIGDMGDSAPTTPIADNTASYKQPWVEDGFEEDQEPAAAACASTGQAPPRLPRRRNPHRVISSSPEEDSHQLPSWMAAQEEEARAKSTFVGDDGGV
ncbi:hypothetical protein HYFRA_00011813 [Hymenoscyphus fraxineus]|uniref:DNA polymerase zeta catalytic subunit n=1 Tax=Hymenoscyphus fraxineus TaxID=746836 RepID=A0A9N9L6Y6_9HELO|nr:hypothetical protein HYFRA_00011813 [Hymenoscyphus fraxineus]